MKILNSTIEDMPGIFKLYDEAIVYQQTKFHKHWQGFDELLIQKEIEQNRQYKIIEDGAIRIKSLQFIFIVLLPIHCLGERGM